MTLEDFFTLTEMKDGLAVPARVKDLVNVMHREKDSIVKSIGDMTRQWSTVASTIIATEDKDCLELFIQLDGLCFIDRWLNDAQRLSVDVNENFVEESITVLLRALEKLQVGYERSSSSGILLTVKNLLNHGSSRVQDGAKALFDQWKKNGDVDDTTSKDVQNGAASGEDVILERSGADTSLPEDEKKCDELDTDEGMPVISAGDVEKDRTDDKEVKEDNDFTAVENSSMEESVVVLADTVEKENDPFTPMVIDEVIEERSNVPVPNDCADDDTKQETTPMNESGAMEIVSTGELQAKVDSSAEDDDLPDAGTAGNVLPMEIDSGKDDYKAPPDNGNATFPAEVNNGEVDEQQEEEEGDDDSSEEENKELTININLLKPAIICKVPNSIDEKKSDIELDYSIVDALEVARQVAIEATREVEEDHREPSCSSSSEKKKMKSVDCSSMKDEEASSSSSRSNSSSSRETLNPKTENSSQLTVSSQEIDLDMDRELEANSGKGLVGLDLNMDISSEDVDQDQPEKPIPTHISQVSASRAAAVSELASSPLQQQPEDGWKGSATTSAFRRVLEGGVDKTTPPPPSTGKLLDFDLNVAEDDEDEEENDKGTTNSRPILDLDLNIISDDSDSLPDHNHSSLKSIDLNVIEDEEPNFDHHHHNLLQPKPLNQSISLMGIRVEVGKRETMMTQQQQPPKDHHHHHPHVNHPPRIGGGGGGGDGFFSFGPSFQYGQMAYNGGPSSSPFTLPPPYMGGGGPPVVPQSQFFMMSPAAAGGGGHYGSGSSSSSSSNHHHNNRILDLNMNMNMGTTNDGGNRDGVGFRQFLSMGGGGGGQNNSLQPSSSSSGYGIGKRKEPEGGWEGYPYNNNLKRQQPPPPWK